MAPSSTPVRYGHLAAQFGYQLPIQVLQSAAGFYIGTVSDDGPVSRESAEYFPTRPAAEAAITSGDWTQRDHP